MTIARTGWRPGFPDVVVHTTEKTRNAHPSYARAKSGDREAATRLACDLLSNAALESIRGARADRSPAKQAQMSQRTLLARKLNTATVYRSIAIWFSTGV